MISPELQDTAIGDFCRARGYQITERMEGLDESGSRAKSRWWAKLDAAVAMVEAGQVDVIVVWKFSRTARNRLKWAVALDRVEAAGGRLESATEQVDTTTSTGRFTRGMLAELNAFEAERIGEQWKETHARRVKAGLHHTGGRRHGYTYTAEKTWVPDPETAPIVVSLYEQYVAGRGLQSLAGWLRAVGLPPRIDGTQWRTHGVSTFLHSGFAAGLIYVHDPLCDCRDVGRCKRRVWLDGAHEPIISSRLWKSYLKERERRSGTPSRLLSPRTPLAGLVRCGACGWGMRSMGAVRSGYQCSNELCPAPTSVRQPRAEALAKEWLAGYAHDVERQAELAASQRESSAAAGAAKARLSRQVLKLDAELTALTRGYVSGVVPEAAYTAARDELLAEKATAEAGLAEATAATSVRRPSRPAVGGLLKRWDTTSAADLNSVLRDLLRVVVTRGPWRSEVRVVAAWEWSPPRPGVV